MKLPKNIAACLLASSLMTAAVHAAKLEVTHWWTFGGEAAAVGELAKAFNSKTSHSWTNA